MKLLNTVAIAAVLIAASACDNIPAYRIMQGKAKGEATFAEAQGARRARVSEAQARLDAAKMTAEAEVIKAAGVAKANKIMAESLGGPEGYLRWKYIEMLEENTNHQVIYIPTEAGLPVLEAGKRPEAAKN